jgi:cytochrome c peroxidase
MPRPLADEPRARRHRLPALLLPLLIAASCGDDGQEPTAETDEWTWDLPSHFPTPRVPEDNPMTLPKIELGRRLFYDTRLSLNETQSCASCHVQELAFTDGRAQGLGSTGELHPRSPMALVNVAFLPRLNWANPLITTLEQQALGPLFGEFPVELGMAGNEDLLLARLREDSETIALFEASFPDEADPVTVQNITRALATFQRTLVSADSPYDRYLQGDTDALSDRAKRGRELFFSEALECFHCHGGALFTDSTDHTGLPIAEVAFHNTGLYNLNGDGAYPAENTGVYEITGDIRDMGRFRAPTLRNIAVTAPYFHDGSALTLREVLEHYAAGGRTIAEEPNAGVGSESPFRSDLVSGFVLTDSEFDDVIAFLESLTDETFLTDPRFSDPFAAEAAAP